MYRVFEYLKKHDVEHKRKVKLSNVSSIRIGGVSEVIVYPGNESELINFVDFLYEEKIRYKIFGRMTNILPKDEGYTGVLISTKRLASFKEESGIVYSGVGIPLNSLIFSAAKQNLGGLEALYGIPGTLGGAIHNNGGAHGFEIANAILGVFVYSPSQKKQMLLDNADLKLSYRTSIFEKEDYIALSAMLAFSSSEYREILTKIKSVREIRRKNQPLSYPSLGSIFKREDGVAVSRLIDEAGFKGYRVGGAEISKKHAGFIINKGGASCNDVLSLIDTVKKALASKYGIVPKEEIEIL